MTGAALRFYRYKIFKGVIKNLPATAGDPGWIPRLGRFPVGGSGNLLQDSCLKNSMDRGAWWATVHAVAESDMN